MEIMEDHDHLLLCTDDESVSDNEDPFLPSEIAEDESLYRPIWTVSSHSKFEFLTTKLLLILSTSFMLILFPPYVESVNLHSDLYSLIFWNTTFSLIAFIIIMLFARRCRKKYKEINFFNRPLKLKQLILLASMFIISGVLITYAIDRKRVLCHLQDPMKAIVIVFSLLYYFVFCKKFMGLQRIFSATTIIVGLFITVDYGLCDEFRCRGYEREHPSDDTGDWSWKTHSMWLVLYLCGLGLLSAYFTIFERFLFLESGVPTFTNRPHRPVYITTLSHSVTHQNGETNDNFMDLMHRCVDNSNGVKKRSALHITIWLHCFAWIVVLLLFWTDLVPSIGKASNGIDMLENLKQGFICQVKPAFYVDIKDPFTCGHTYIFSWLFLFCYVIYSIMSVKFLMLSESAVYTVATMSSSLPIIGIWWSVYHLVPDKTTGAYFLYAPSVTGELICSLLGLPIVLIGLILLCKSHFKDFYWSNISPDQVTSNTLFSYQ